MWWPRLLPRRCTGDRSTRRRRARSRARCVTVLSPRASPSVQGRARSLPLHGGRCHHRGRPGVLTTSVVDSGRRRRDQGWWRVTGKGGRSRAAARCLISWTLLGAHSLSSGVPACRGRPTCDQACGARASAAGPSSAAAAADSARVTSRHTPAASEAVPSARRNRRPAGTVGRRCRHAPSELRAPELRAADRAPGSAGALNPARTSARRRPAGGGSFAPKVRR